MKKTNLFIVIALTLLLAFGCAKAPEDVVSTTDAVAEEISFGATEPSDPPAILQDDSKAPESDNIQDGWGIVKFNIIFVKVDSSGQQAGALSSSELIEPNYVQIGGWKGNEIERMEPCSETVIQGCSIKAINENGGGEFQKQKLCLVGDRTTSPCADGNGKFVEYMLQYAVSPGADLKGHVEISCDADSIGKRIGANFKSWWHTVRYYDSGDGKMKMRLQRLGADGGVREDFTLSAARSLPPTTLG